MKGAYILDENGTPVPCQDGIKWDTWMCVANRHVAEEQVGDARVSTVFLGLDHSFGGGPPELFETMIFGGPYDLWCARYATRAQAMSRHNQIVLALRNGFGPEGDSNAPD